MCFTILKCEFFSTPDSPKTTRSVDRLSGFRNGGILNKRNLFSTTQKSKGDALKTASNELHDSVEALKASVRRK